MTNNVACSKCDSSMFNCQKMFHILIIKIDCPSVCPSVRSVLRIRWLVKKVVNSRRVTLIGKKFVKLRQVDRFAESTTAIK